MMTKPKTKRQLWGFIYAHFGLAIPYRTFTDGFSNPFDFIADAFFNPAKDVAVWANRSGIKTLGASILAALEFAFTDNLHARVLSGSEDQARNLYEYWSRWACMPMLRGRVEGNVGKLMTRIGGGTFEILAASQKRVRGPKLQKLFRDEIDETDPDILDASVGMLAGTDKIPSRIVDCSTYHRADGPMARLVEGIDRSGITLHKWGLWESLEKCPAKRHDLGIASLRGRFRTIGVSPRPTSSKTQPSTGHLCLPLAVAISAVQVRCTRNCGTITTPNARRR